MQWPEGRTCTPVAGRGDVYQSTFTSHTLSHGSLFTTALHFRVITSSNITDTSRRRRLTTTTGGLGEFELITQLHKCASTPMSLSYPHLHVIGLCGEAKELREKPHTHRTQLSRYMTSLHVTNNIRKNYSICSML